MKSLYLSMAMVNGIILTGSLLQGEEFYSVAGVTFVWMVFWSYMFAREIVYRVK